MKDHDVQILIIKYHLEFLFHIKGIAWESPKKKGKSECMVPHVKWVQLSLLAYPFEKTKSDVFGLPNFSDTNIWTSHACEFFCVWKFSTPQIPKISSLVGRFKSEAP